MAGSSSADRLPLAMLGIAVVIFGAGYWPTAVAAEQGPSLMVTGLRLATSAALLIVLALAMRSQFPRGAMLGWGLFTGALMVGLFHWGVTEGVDRAGAGNAAVLINTNPLMVLVLAWIFLRERLSPVGVIGLVLGFAGVVLMVSSQLGGSIETSQLVLGCVLALIAALSWSIGVLILRKLSQRPGDIDMVGFTTVQFLFAGLLLMIAAFAVDGTTGTEWSSASFWAATAWTGPLAAVALVLFYVVLKQLSAAKTSSALFLVPAVAVIVEIARGNAPEPIVLVGMAVAVIGVALAVVPAEQLASLPPRVRKQLRGV